ncbi:hypothetical protein [Neptuniibacter sp. QD37_11]|uniref:hypothetical protein n=1 Tax=Neptuniibacter sp. QD37_11 TaxID=3398209 RepID=UPI0039F457E3
MLKMIHYRSARACIKMEDGKIQGLINDEVVIDVLYRPGSAPKVLFHKQASDASCIYEQCEIADVSSRVLHVAKLIQFAQPKSESDWGDLKDHLTALGMRTDILDSSVIPDDKLSFVKTVINHADENRSASEMWHFESFPCHLEYHKEACRLKEQGPAIDSITVQVFTIAEICRMNDASKVINSMPEQVAHIAKSMVTAGNHTLY